MIRVLHMLGRIAPQAMAAGVFLGLLAPSMAHVLRPCLTPAVWGLLVLTMLRLDWRDVLARIVRPVLPGAVVLWMLAVSPMLMSLLLEPFHLRPGIFAAMVLTAGSAPLFSAPAVGLMFGLDGALLLVVLVAATLLVPLTLPLVAGGLLGLHFSVGTVELMLRLAGLVLSAVAVAALVRRGLGADRLRALGAGIDGVNVILLILFAVGIMDGVTARILADPVDTARVTALSFAGYVGPMIATAWVFKLLLPGHDRRMALSAAFITGTRNLGIILAVLPTDADPDIPLFFALGQFPIYIMPAVLRPVFRSLLGSEKAK